MQRKFLTAFIAIFTYTIVSSDPIPFPGGDVKFHEWLNRVYIRSYIDPATMDRVKTEITKKIREIAKIMKESDDCFDVVQLRGSAEEGLKIDQPDEFDFVLRFNQSGTEKIAFNEKPGLPGFAYAIRKGATKCFDKYRIDNPKDAIDPVQVRAHMLELVEKALTKLKISSHVTEVGPAINFELPSGEKSFDKVDIDLVLYIQQKAWPTTAASYLPSAFKDIGVGLVPKVLDQDTKVWQISFSAIEIAILKNIDADGGIRKKLLKIAKYLKLRTNWPKTVSSYNLKTIIMKMDQEHKTAGYWLEANLVPRFRDLMNNFLTSLRAGNMPSFFIPSYNLFQGKDLTEAIEKVEGLLHTIATDPNSLFPPPKKICDPQNPMKKKSRKVKRSLKKILKIHK